MHHSYHWWLARKACFNVGKAGDGEAAERYIEVETVVNFRNAVLCRAVLVSGDAAGAKDERWPGSYHSYLYNSAAADLLYATWVCMLYDSTYRTYLVYLLRLSILQAENRRALQPSALCSHFPANAGFAPRLTQLGSRPSWEMEMGISHFKPRHVWIGWRHYNRYLWVDGAYFYVSTYLTTYQIIQIRQISKYL